MSDQDRRTGAAVELDSSSAMVRAESVHLDATLHALVRRMSSVPGLKMTVSYRRGKLRRLIGDLPYINDLHRRNAPVSEIVVVAEPWTYALQAERGSISCVREGISLERGPGREELSFSVWATRLFDEIGQQNSVNHESMLALRHLVEHDRVA